MRCRIESDGGGFYDGYGLKRHAPTTWYVITGDGQRIDCRDYRHALRVADFQNLVFGHSPSASVRLAGRDIGMNEALLMTYNLVRSTRRLLSDLCRERYAMEELRWQQDNTLRSLRAILSDILKCDTKNREENDVH